MRYHIIMAVGYKKDRIFKRGDLVDFAEEDVPADILKLWERGRIIESEAVKIQREKQEEADAVAAVDADLAAFQEAIETDMREVFPGDYEDDECAPGD